MFEIKGNTPEDQQIRTSIKEKFKEQHSDVDLAWLKKYACWIIVDPWRAQPDQHIHTQNTNKGDQVIINKITEYLPEVKHWLISCERGCTVTSQLAHLENLYDHENKLHEYMHVYRHKVCIKKIKFNLFTCN
jgi:5S rRNA maturation endonuclease (ribonuclease M5)